MNSNQTQHIDNTATSIDIGTVFAGILARKSWIILATLLAAAGSVAFVSVATPEYQATSRVLVENLETSFSRTGQQRAGGTTIGQQEVKSQVEVLTSRDLAKKVITRLAQDDKSGQGRAINLLESKEFDPVRRGIGPVSKILISLGFKTDPTKQTPTQRVLDTYFKKMTAYQIPDSKVIVITMKSKDPLVAAAVANTLAEEFVNDTRTVQSRTTGRAREWLAGQIETLSKKVVASEIDAEKFRASAGLLKGRDQNATLSSQELSELNTQIILAEAQRAEIQARAKSIRDLLARTGSVASSSEVLNSSLIQRLRERQITLRGNLADLSTTYLPNHPRVVAVRSQLDGLNRQVRSEALKIVSGLEQQSKVSTARVASLRASLNGLKSIASGTNLDQVTLRALERKAAANRSLLETFLTKYSDASSRESSVAQPGLARLISRADTPSEPSFPKPGPTVLLATIGGFVLSAGLAFMASVMGAVSGTGTGIGTGTTRRPQVARENVAAAPIEGNVQPVTALPVTAPPVPQPAPNPPPAAGPVSSPSLSQLPSSNDLQTAQANARAAVQNSSSDFSIGLAPVTSWVNSTRQTLGIRRLAMVGLPGAENDTAAACLGLARSLAAQQVRTIVIDAAMHGSQLAAMTGTENLPGVADLLTGHASFMDVIIKDEHSDARIVRVGQSLGAAWPLMSGKRMETVLAALDNQENHDMVIVHGGVMSPQPAVENGAVAKCQSGLLIVPGDQTAMTDEALKNLSATGMRAIQYVRIVDGGGLHQMPDNVTHLNATLTGQAAHQAQSQAAQSVTAKLNQPLFPKVAN